MAFRPSGLATSLTRRVAIADRIKPQHETNRRQLRGELDATLHLDGLQRSEPPYATNQPADPATPVAPPAPKTLQGLNSGDVQVTMEDAFGVKCGHVEGGNDENHIDCTKAGLTITINWPKSSGLDILSIRTTTDRGRAAALSAFDAMGALPYDGARPAETRPWIAQHIDATDASRFGPALFAIAHQGLIYSLNIQAV